MGDQIKQRTLATMTGCERYTKKTRRAMFLAEMEQVVPWTKLCGTSRPRSTSTRYRSRDPDVHQTGKGMEWYFEMKAHVGVDRKTKSLHTAAGTAANVSDVGMLPDLLHREDPRVWNDGACQG